MENKQLRYIDTGKVKIGIYHQRKLHPDMNHDMENVQRVILPKPIGTMDSFTWPTLRQMVRWLVS